MRRVVVVLCVVAMIGCARDGGRKTGGGESSVGQTTQPTTRPIVVRAWKPKAYPKDQVNLLAMADWGTDNKDQVMVAKALAKYVEKARVQFHGLLSPGDNQYGKMKWGVEDNEWQKLFEDMYDAKRINFPFYCVLGNHDYEGTKVQSQLEYARRHPDSRFKMPAKWYRLDLPDAEKPIVTILMLDSDRHKMTRDEWAGQLAWFEEELAKPRRATWLVCSGHHPMFSNGAHDDNGVIQREWGTLMRQYKVDFYVTAHDHDLQHLEVPGWPMAQILCGGGGREQKNMRRNDRGPFSRKLFGFVDLRFFADRVEGVYINGRDGKVVHRFVRERAGRMQVVQTTASDKPDKKQGRLKIFDEADKTTPEPPTLSPDPTPDPPRAGKSSTKPSTKPATQPAAKTKTGK
jgi:hypothetical protein